VLHGGAGLLDHADELMAHVPRVVGERLGLVRPQVAAADAARHDADHRIRRLLDLRVLDVLDAYVAGLVKECRAHNRAFRFVRSFSALEAPGYLAGMRGAW
jgi:hypothetical protein